MRDIRLVYEHGNTLIHDVTVMFTEQAKHSGAELEVERGGIIHVGAPDQQMEFLIPV